MLGTHRPTCLAPTARARLIVVRSDDRQVPSRQRLRSAYVDSAFSSHVSCAVLRWQLPGRRSERPSAAVGDDGVAGGMLDAAHENAARVVLERDRCRVTGD